MPNENNFILMDSNIDDYEVAEAWRKHGRLIYSWNDDFDDAYQVSSIIMGKSQNSISLCTIEVALARGGLIHDNGGITHSNYAGCLSFPMTYTARALWNKDLTLRLLMSNDIPVVDERYALCTLRHLQTYAGWAEAFGDAHDFGHDWHNWEAYIKPTDILKPLNAHRFHILDGVMGLRQVICGYPEPIPLDTQVMVSARRELLLERRLWVVDGKVVATGDYNLGNIDAKVPDAESLIDALAKQVVKIKFPFGNTYCLDVAIDSDNIARVLEINPMTTSALYNADPEKLIPALMQYVDKRTRLFQTLPYKGELRRHYILATENKIAVDFLKVATAVHAAMLKEHGDDLWYSVMDIYDIFETWHSYKGDEQWKSRMDYGMI